MAGEQGAEVVQIERAFSKGQKRRAARLIKAGRPRDFSISREPNGRRSRRKEYHEPGPSWLAPSIAKEINMHPVEALYERGAITQDQKISAYRWLRDRKVACYPTLDPPGVDLEQIPGARGESGDDPRRVAEAKARYNELHRKLLYACGQFGLNLAFSTIIEHRQDTDVANYWTRLGHRTDPTARQTLCWRHLLMAFGEIEAYYAAQISKKRLDRNSEAA
jgi:hypothetical protein